MNSYFASCEQQANPHLRLKPVGVCEHLGGIIIAPSIEAKRRGVKTAMPVWEARKICPDIILLPVDPPKYREITRRFLKIFSDYSDLVERYSIDEAFLDVTGLLARHPDSFGVAQGRPELNRMGDRSGGISQQVNILGRKDPSASPCFAQDDRRLWNAALMLALEIKWRIRREVGEWLTCSVGAGPNKLVAKIASDLDKPDGAVVISHADKESLYNRLRLTDIPGIGFRTQRRLADLKIYSLRDLAECPESKLRAYFGLVGLHMRNMGKLEGGIDLATQEKETIKSMGHSFTLPRATCDRKVVKKLLFKLSEKVAARLRRHNFWGSEIGCYFRFAVSPGFPVSSAGGRPSSPIFSWEPDRVGSGSSYSGVGKSYRTGELINDGRLIFKQAWKIFKSLNRHNPVRMAGVTVSGLVENFIDEPLFERYRKPVLAVSAMDKVNDKYGDFTLRRAALLDISGFAGDSIGFGRIREL